MNGAEDVALHLWRERLARGMTGELTVLSGSMIPLLRPGERLLVAPRPRRLWPGDLAVFVRDGRLICHRLLWPLRGGRFRESGDASLGSGLVAGADIIGVPLAVTDEDGASCALTGPRFRRRNRLLWLLFQGRILRKPSRDALQPTQLSVTH